MYNYEKTAGLGSFAPRKIFYFNLVQNTTCLQIVFPNTPVFSALIINTYGKAPRTLPKNILKYMNESAEIIIGKISD